MRRLSALLAVLLAVGILGCGSTAETAAPARPETQPAVTPDTTAEQPAPEADTSTPPEEPAIAEFHEPNQVNRTEPETTATAPAHEPDEPEPVEPEKPAALPELWDFTAEWCPPCKTQNPILHEVEKEFAGTVEVRVIDVDQERELAGKFGIRVIPTQVFLDAEGKELSRHSGVMSRDSIVGRFKAHGFIE